MSNYNEQNTMTTSDAKTMPIVPLRGITVLPGVLFHFDVVRDFSVQAIQHAMSTDQMVLLVAQKDDNVEEPKEQDLYKVGTVAVVKQIIKISSKAMRVMVSGVQRGEWTELVETKPFLKAQTIIYPEAKQPSLTEVEQEGMLRAVKELFQMYCLEQNKSGAASLQVILKEDNLELLLDEIGMNLLIPLEQKQRLLEERDLMKRYEQVSVTLSNEIEVLRTKKEFQEKVNEHVNKNQKEYLLREQMKVIQEELGENHTISDAEKYTEQLQKLKASKSVKKKIASEIGRFKSVSNNSSESAVIRAYIETLLALPWEKRSKDRTDLAYAEKVLNRNHYGMDKVKERILEFLAVRSLTGKGESPIICLVGPPGTGKTSIARSVAEALDKKYCRICLGGVRDEAEIRGHRRTYVGAMPGRIAVALKNAKVKNPLILLDEIDKMSSDYKGDTASAMLEVLDSEQNSKFQDHYVELAMDLSEVLFLCTANDLQTIPRPLIDRMEIIEVSSYTENEKLHIAKEHLLAKQKERNGLSKSQLTISTKALQQVILHYTREAGVRNLERKLGELCRKAAKELIREKKTQIRITDKNLEHYLGKQKYTLEEANETSEIGIVRGLAWTSVGGVTLQIEVNVMPGKGAVELTGQMGDVMKESAKAGISYIRSISSEHGIAEDYFEKHDIHIHIPEGAVPKDGPSAGITMATAIFSAITGRKVRADVAMTGEITLRGRVLPIGGLKEKVLAAKYAKIKTVLIPEKNRKDKDELEAEITDGIQIYMVGMMDEVFKKALAD